MLQKKYTPEFKKIVVQYLADKKVVITTDRTNIDFENGFPKKSDKDKDRDSLQVSRLKYGVISVDSNFFTANDTEYGKISLPAFIYKNHRITSLILSTNERFYDNGHDLSFNINSTTVQAGYQNKKIRSKINLERNIYDVLDDIWSRIEKAIDDYDNGSLDNTSTNITSDKVENEEVKSDIERIFEFTLKKKMKNVKNPITQKKTREAVNVGYDSPVRFTLNYTNTQKLDSSFKTFEHTSFTIDVEMTVRDSSGKGFLNRNPEILEKFEKYKEIANTSPVTYEHVLSISNVLPSKVYEENEEQYIRKLREFCKRVAQLGYSPKNWERIGSKRDKDRIIFVYSRELEKLYENNKSLAIQFTSNQIKRIVDFAIEKRGIFVGDIDNYFQKILGTNFARWYLKGDKTSEDGKKYLEAFTTKSSTEAKKNCIRYFFDPNSVSS